MLTQQSNRSSKGSRGINEVLSTMRHERIWEEDGWRSTQGREARGSDKKVRRNAFSFHCVTVHLWPFHLCLLLVPAHRSPRSPTCTVDPSLVAAKHVTVICWASRPCYSRIHRRSTCYHINMAVGVNGRVPRHNFTRCKWSNAGALEKLRITRWRQRVNVNA